LPAKKKVRREWLKSGSPVNDGDSCLRGRGWRSGIKWQSHSRIAGSSPTCMIMMIMMMKKKKKKKKKKKSKELMNLLT
jgi:hypothetical protein